MTSVSAGSDNDKCFRWQGLWFASMNYFVHSVMYTYFFFAVVSEKTRKCVMRPTPPLPPASHGSWDDHNVVWTMT